MRPRVLCWFSCGAASAVSAKLAVSEYGDRCEVLYCDTSSDEHPDNLRFLTDVENWIGQKIKRLKSKKYRDRWHVYRTTRFLVGKKGARCTVELKKVLRFDYQRPDDIHVLGFALEERSRLKRFKERNPELNTRFFLVEKSLSKSDCLGFLWRAGIKMPVMYELGFNNNNCIGCVYGGAGYWNKIREHFPENFDRMAALERELGYSLLADRFLDQLEPGGRYPFQEPVGCSVFCEMAYQETKVT